MSISFVNDSLSQLRGYYSSLDFPGELNRVSGRNERPKTSLRTLSSAPSLSISRTLTISPRIRDSKTTDYINQIYQDQVAQNSYMDQLQQTQDYINQIYQDQAAQNSYMDQLQPDPRLCQSNLPGSETDE